MTGRFKMKSVIGKNPDISAPHILLNTFSDKHILSETCMCNPRKIPNLYFPSGYLVCHQIIEGDDPDGYLHVQYRDNK